MPYICKWLHSLVFSYKDDKPSASSRYSSLFTILRADVKEPTHCSKRVGHGDPGVVVWLTGTKIKDKNN